jgi:hypothetical protein
VVAKNLGHTDTRMVEKHYGHLAPSYIAEAIRAGAPRFAGAEMPTLVPMPVRSAARNENVRFDRDDALETPNYALARRNKTLSQKLIG